MNKVCARPECGKIVYPIEELKCLDKVWHKQCFKCHVCGMTLSMKNYKGYEKTPYCDALSCMFRHYPKTKASVVADTPEMKRLAENTKNQSLFKYHEDFEKMKGKKTEIVDDPELIRHLKNTQIVSNVAYHGDVERKELMDKTRPPYENTFDSRDVGSAVPPPLGISNLQQHSMNASPGGFKGQSAAGLMAHSPPGYAVSAGVGGPVRQVGSIADYDPLNGQFSSIVSGRTPQSQTVYSHQPGGYSSNAPLHTSGYVQAQSATKFGGGATSPSYGSAVDASNGRIAGANQQPAMSATATAASSYHQAARNRTNSNTSAAFRALYDYKAADADEVTFNEGDLIVNCQRVDEGWMTGTVQRTGQWGMLPANYVEKTC